MRHHRRRRQRFSTRSRCSLARLVEGDLARAAGAAGAGTHARRARQSLHHLRLRPHRAASSRASSRGRACRSSSSSAIPSGCTRPSTQGFLAVEADASSEEVLRRLGIERARGFIAAVSTDAENVYAVLTRALLRPDLFIVGRAETDDARAQADAGRRRSRDLAVSHRRSQLAQTALRPAVVDFVQLATGSENLDLNMEQVHDRRADRRWPTHRSSRPTCASDSASSSSASSAPDGRMEFNPPPESVDAAPATTSSSSGRRRVCASSKPRAAGQPAVATGDAHDARALLDGTARLPRRFARVRPAGRARVHRPRRPAARTRDRPRRRRSRVGNLRPQQGEGGHRDRPAGRPAAAARDGVARPSCWRSSSG